MKSIYNLKKTKTLIIVTHRLSTIVDCDKIYYLKKGKLITQNPNNLNYE